MDDTQWFARFRQGFRNDLKRELAMEETGNDRQLHGASAAPTTHGRDQIGSELTAIRSIYDTLKALSPEARVRVFRYVNEVMAEEQ